MGWQWKQWQTLFWGDSRVTADVDCSHEIKRCFLLGRKQPMTNLDSILKSRDIALPTKVRLDKDMVFPVVMYGCESWTVKKAECRRIDAFELWCWRRLLSPLDCKDTQPVYFKGEQSWVFFGKNAKAETPVLWPSHEKSWLIGKDSAAGRDWGQEEKETTEEAEALGSVWVLRIVIWTPKQFAHKLPDPSVGSSGASQQGTRMDPESFPGHRSLQMSPRPVPLDTQPSSVTPCKIVLHGKASQTLACKDRYILLSCFERVSKWSRQLSLRNPRNKELLKAQYSEN